MDDHDRTRDELISELTDLRRRLVDLEGSQEREGTIESALRESENRYHTLVETIPHGIEECDTQGRITFTNAALHRINGFGVGEIDGMHIWDFLCTDESKEELRQYLRYLVEQQPLPTAYTAVNRRKDGTTYDVQVDWDYRYDKDGTLAGFTAIITDVTHRKQAEDALRRGRDELERRVNERTRELAQANEKLTKEISERELAERTARNREEVYHRIFDTVADGLLLVGQDSKISEANRAACEIYGYAAEELIGLEVVELIHPEDRFLFGQVAQQIDSGNGAQVEAVNLRKDSSHIWIELRATLFELDNTKQALCVVRDLTARKRAEAALEDSENRFRLAFESGPVGMVIASLGGQIVKANRSLCQMLGYSTSELERLTIDELTHPDDRHLNRRFMERLGKQSSAQISAEKRYLRKGGAVIWGRVTVANLPAQPGEARHAFAMVEDITEQKAAQEAVEMEQQHLRRLLEMHEHDRQLVAYEIHDGFIQSLVGARMLLDMPRDKLQPEMRERFETAVNLINRGINEARRLISGQRPLILDERGLMAAIEHLVCERQIDDGPEIIYQDLVSFSRLAPPLETAIFRVVQEGLHNAEKHSQSATIRLRVTQIGDRLRIEIQDWGVGFDPAGIGPGCFGLEGLRERARIFGGTAEINTAYNVGTTVTVEFPIVANSAQGGKT